MSCPWFVSLVRVPELLDSIRVPKGHKLRDTNRVVSLVRVPELSGTILTTQGHIQGHDSGTRHDSRDTTRFVSLKVPEILDTIRVPKGHEIRDTIRDTIVSLSRVPESCPWRSRDTNRVPGP